jgi:hypothetical protein
MGGSSNAPAWLNPGSSGFASAWGVGSQGGAGPPTQPGPGQDGQFSSLGASTDTGTMGGAGPLTQPGPGQMGAMTGAGPPTQPGPGQGASIGGNMLSSPPPTSAGTSQALLGQSSQITPPHVTMPFSGQPPTPPQVLPQTQPWSSGASSSGSSPFQLFGGGGQQGQFMQEIMQMLRGGGNA